jgi:hypothetical protein
LSSRSSLSSVNSFRIDGMYLYRIIL